jgi:sterol desaturase/sphingolipid hydroxylase (fatty acid hydroxylase superfamily)
VLLDFLIYWWHRANHRWHPLWRFHLVHHLDRILDSTSALRFHFGEVLISAAARAGAILLLGFPFLSIVAFETLLLIATIFHHSNLRLPPRLEAALASLVITPSIHWVHHHRRRIDTDSNYGTVFSFWDRLFASRSRARRSPEMEIGVEGGELARCSCVGELSYRLGSGRAISGTCARDKVGRPTSSAMPMTIQARTA